MPPTVAFLLVSKSIYFVRMLLGKTDSRSTDSQGRLCGQNDIVSPLTIL